MEFACSFFLLIYLACLYSVEKCIVEQILCLIIESCTSSNNCSSVINDHIYPLVGKPLEHQSIWPHIGIKLTLSLCYFSAHIILASCVCPVVHGWYITTWQPLRVYLSLTSLVYSVSHDACMYSCHMMEENTMVVM